MISDQESGIRESIHAAAEAIANDGIAARPTPDEIDARVRRYIEIKNFIDIYKRQLEVVEAELTELCRIYGAVPPYAEKSRRLAGRLAEITVTRSDALIVNHERVEALREALEANGYPAFFGKLFAKVEKYEIVDGAEAALKTESLPKRLSEKVLNLFGRCITVRPKKPTLRVTLADPAKAKKRRKPNRRAIPSILKSRSREAIAWRKAC